MSGFASGLTFWIKGWSYLLQHRSLLGLALFPFLIVLLAASGFGFLIFSHLNVWAHALLSWLAWSPRINSLLYYPLLFSSALLILVMGTYLTYILQGLLAIPFNAILVEHTLEELGKKKTQPWELRSWVKRSLNMLRIGLIKSVIFLLFGVVLFVFSFLPVLNLLAFAGALLLVAYDCIDYSFEAMEFGLRQRFAYVAREWTQWAGMASSLALTLMIPGLTLLLIPGAVVGAALIIKTESQKA